MKPALFDNYRPNSLDEAVGALAASDSSKVLAGGQSLIPAMNFRLSSPSLLVDIQGMPEFGALTVDSGGVRIGAAVTQSTVERSPDASAAVSALRQALRYVGHLQIRNKGTVCGSLAHADPAAELPALAVALGAELAIHNAGGSRLIAAGDFYRGPFWVDLEPEDILTEAYFPAPPAGTVTVVDEISRRAGDFAIVGLAAVVAVDEGTVTSATLVSFGVGGKPERLATAESAIVGFDGNGASDALYDAAFQDADGALDDGHATAIYRQEALASVVVRAARAALDSAQDGRRNS